MNTWPVVVLFYPASEPLAAVERSRKPPYLESNFFTKIERKKEHRLFHTLGLIFWTNTLVVSLQLCCLQTNKNLQGKQIQLSMANTGIVRIDNQVYIGLIII
jgi:hypothetical protein